MWFGFITLAALTHLVTPFKHTSYLKIINSISCPNDVSFCHKLYSRTEESNSICDDSTTNENVHSVDKLSPEFQRLLIGLIVYKVCQILYNILHHKGLNFICDVTYCHAELFT